MPKGVYERNKGMRTAIVDKTPEPTMANSNAVEPIQQTNSDDEFSTTQKLFGDLVNQDGTRKEEIAPVLPISQSPDDIPEPNIPGIPGEDPKQPIPGKEPEKAPEAPPEPVKEPTPPPADLDWEKPIPIKIDGKEDVIPLKKLRDNYQIGRHLDMAADKVGEERKRLAEERRQLQELRMQQRQEPFNPQQQGQEQAPSLYAPPSLDPIQARLNFLESQYQRLNQATVPIVWQNNRMQLDAQLKSQGFNDFNDYWPKIQAYTPPELVQQMGGNEMAAAELMYHRLKSQEPKAPAPVAPPAPVIQQSVSRPPITRIDGGSQSSNGGNDDSGANYRQSFNRARVLPNDTQAGREAWNDVLRQKGILPE
jgi:hypothetical protein